ncbi:hypothetical protein DVH24_029277 [Malus domestica]|uniref:Uncharacterized protein n=1 Tax=Malus domestica TaxID=3750 RepID=A0A498HSZ5_MALDO|nr:hypothetical protein DVH24_029277 [Malus domestica]
MQHDSANINGKPTSTAGGSMEDNREAEKRGGKKDRVIAPKPRAARRSESVKDVTAALEREPRMSRFYSDASLVRTNSNSNSAGE